MKISLLALSSGPAIAGLLAIAQSVQAQPGPPPPTPLGPPAPAEQAAPIDLSGYWVANVTEDWRWRMMTAPAGDYASVPLNAEGIKIAKLFDRTKYGTSWTSQRIDCRAYYMAGLMRMPERLHITWLTPDELEIQTDWGEQTRIIYFRHSDIPAALEQSSAQGRSSGVWHFPFPVEGGENGGFGPYRGPKPPGGDLTVKTDHLLPGWLRRNGVPYSGQTTVTEHFQVFEVPINMTKWFDVTTEVNDPVYLTSQFVTSSDFEKEPDGSKWRPHPCVNISSVE